MDGGGFGVASDRRWYAVRCHPRKESLAELHLARQGFAAFLPKISKVIRYPTRTATVSAPFFQGYLFVSLSLARDRWRAVSSTIGVQRIVAFGDRPAAAPIGLVESFLENADEGGRIRFDHSFAPGDRIRIVGGPLDGHFGTFERLDAGDRVTVLLQLLSREVCVKVSKSAIMTV